MKFPRPKTIKILESPQRVRRGLVDRPCSTGRTRLSQLTSLPSATRYHGLATVLCLLIVGALPTDLNGWQESDPASNQSESSDQSKSSDSLAQQAEQAFHDQDWRAAATLLEKVRLSDPASFKQINGYLLEGQCHYELGNFDRSILAFEQWEQRLPTGVSLSGTNGSGTEGLRRSLALARLLRVNALYFLALQSSEPGTQEQRFRECESLADSLITGLPGSDYAKWAQLVRFKAAMQLKFGDPLANRDTLRWISDRFLELAQAESADSERSVRRSQEARYYAALCLQKVGDLAEAQSILGPLHQELQNQETTSALTAHVLSTLAENRLATVMQGDTPLPQSEQTEQLDTAEKLYTQLQTQYPNHDPAIVSYNLGTILQLQNDPASAVQQFVRVGESASATPQLRWSAMLKEASARIKQGDLQTAEPLLSKLLQETDVAQDRQLVTAVEMSLDLAAQRQDYAAIEQLLQQHQSRLSDQNNANETYQFYTALTDVHSQDPARRKQGLTVLQQLADSESSLAYQAQMESARTQFQQWNRVAANRPNFDQQQQQEFQADLNACVQQCQALLASEPLDVSDIPVNPQLISDAQRARLDRRDQVQSWLAFTYLQMNRFQEAHDVYQQLLSQPYQSEQRVDWVVGQSQALQQIEDPQAAVAFLQEQVDDTRLTEIQKLKVRGVLGSQQEQMGDHANAALTFKGLYRDANAADLRQQALVDALYNLNKAELFHQTIRLADEVDSSLSGRPLAFVQSSRGIAHFFLNDYAAAEEDMEQVIQRVTGGMESNPTDPLLLQALNYRAQSLKKLGDERVDQAMQEIISRFPKSAEAQLARTTLTEMGIAIVEPSVPSDSADPTSNPRTTRETSGTATAAFESRLAQADRLQSEDRWEEAVTLLQELISNADPEEAGLGDAYFELGYSQRKLENWSAAQSSLETAAASPLTPALQDRTWYYLADVHYMQKDMESAAEYFAKAADSSTEDIRIKSLYRLAWTLHYDQQYQPAIERFREIQERFPDHSLAQDATLQVIRNQYFAGDYDTAYQGFQDLFQERSESDWKDAREQVVARLTAGKVALHTENYQQAKDWLEGLEALVEQQQVDLSVNDSGEILYQLALAHQGLGQDQAARKIFAELAKSTTVWGAESLNLLAADALKQNDLNTATVRYRSLAEGVYGDPPSLIIGRLQANAALQVGQIKRRLARQATTTSERNSLNQEARQWLRRAADQTLDEQVASQAESELNELAL